MTNIEILKKAMPKSFWHDISLVKTFQEDMNDCKRYYDEDNEIAILTDKVDKLQDVIEALIEIIEKQENK